MRPTAAEHSFRSRVFGSSCFKRGTQTVSDDLRSGRIIFYGVRKLLGKCSGCYRMLSDGPEMYNSL